MSTIGAQTSLYAEDRGIQVPMTLEYGNIVGTQCCDKTIETRQLDGGFQIGVIRFCSTDSFGVFQDSAGRK